MNDPLDGEIRRIMARIEDTTPPLPDFESLRPTTNGGRRGPTAWIIAGAALLVVVVGLFVGSLDQDPKPAISPASPELESDATTPVPATTGPPTLTTVPDTSPAAPTSMTPSQPSSTSATSTTSQPTTTTVTVAPPTTTPFAAGTQLDWGRSFNAAAANGASVFTDSPRAIAFDVDDETTLVALVSGRTVTVPGPLAERIAALEPVADGFIVATVADTVVLDRYSYDGSVSRAGSVPFGNAGAPTQVSLAARDEVIYVAARATPGQGAIAEAFASVHDQDTTLLTPTLFGTITFTNSGDLVVTALGDSAVRTVSTDGGRSWTDVSIPTGQFSDPAILLGIDNTTAIVFDATHPASVGTATAAGSVTNQTDVTAETVGWTVVIDSIQPTVTVVGKSSGQSVDVDRATGAITSEPTPAFDTAGASITRAWRDENGLHALARCSETCTAFVVLDAV